MAVAHLTDVESRLLDAMENDFPFVPRPFAELGWPLGLTEDAAMETAEDLQRRGMLRGVGAVVDPERLGWSSALCRTRVTPEQSLGTRARLRETPAVASVYGGPAFDEVWFRVVLRPPVTLDHVVESAREQAGIKVEPVPTDRRFKPNGSPPTPFAPTASRLTHRDQEVLKALMEPVPVTRRPFTAVAGRLLTTETEVLQRVEDYVRMGVIRKYGALLDRAEKRCVETLMLWKVHREDALRAGLALSSQEEISLCQQSPDGVNKQVLLCAVATFPRGQEGMAFNRLSSSAGLLGGLVLPDSGR